MDPFKLIPLPYRLLIMAVSALALIAFGFWEGVEHEQKDLIACKVNEATLEGAVKAGTAATDRWRAAAMAAQKGGGAAVDEAEKKGKPAADEAKRLDAAAEAAKGKKDTPRPVGCPPSGADRAVAKIREGLVK